MDRTLVEVVKTDDGTFAAKIQVFESDTPGEFIKHYLPDETFESRREALEWAAAVDFTDEDLVHEDGEID